MIRTTLGAISVLAMAAMVGVVAFLVQPGAVETQSHSANRSFQPTLAAPGAELRINIAASNYGAFGQVVETLPDGFTFVKSDLEGHGVEVDGQVLRFQLLGDTSFHYIVTVPEVPGVYTFSGIIKNIDREESSISGHTRLNVGAPPTPEPTATPLRTATPEPTAAPEPEPTATPTASPEPTAAAGADSLAGADSRAGTHGRAGANAYPGTGSRAYGDTHACSD